MPVVGGKHYPYTKKGKAMAKKAMMKKKGRKWDFMPLSKSGKKVLSSMKKQYGTKKGKNVFYASMNKGKVGSSKWHR